MLLILFTFTIQLMSLKGALKDFGSAFSAERVCVPAYERIKELHALQMSYADISEAVNSEFEDILLNPITVKNIKSIVVENSEDFKKYRQELGLSYRAQIQEQMEFLHNKTAGVERKLVAAYAEKLDILLDEFILLDPQELDDDGNRKNTSRCFVLLELIDKMHVKIEKITGTQTLRDVEAFRIKLEYKAASEKGSGMLPAYPNGTTIDVGSMPGKML